MIDPNLTVFDLETTGVDRNEARIVTAFVGRMRPDGTLTDSHRWLVNPGIPIPESATEIHGITDADAAAGMDPVEAVLEIEGLLAAAIMSGSPLVIMNATFDLGILQSEVARHFGRPLSFEPMPVLDPYVLDKALDTYRKGKRTLTALCEHYGIPFEDAHNAEADATATGRLALELLHRTIQRAVPDYAGDIADIPVDDVHRWQTVWARRQRESFRDYLIGKGDLETARDVYLEWPLIPIDAPRFEPTDRDI